MSLSITSIRVNENNKVTSVGWEWTTSLGRVTGDHTMQTPEGSVAIASLTNTTVAGWVASQIDTSGLDAIAAANGFGIPTSTSYEIQPDGSFGAPEFGFGIENFEVKVVSEDIYSEPTAEDEYPELIGTRNYFSPETISPKINAVLRLDQSDATNAGHPIGFYTDENKTTPYTTGVTSVGTAGTAGAYVTLDVLSSTPSPLYYECVNHDGMGGTITVDFG